MKFVVVLAIISLVLSFAVAYPLYEDLAEAATDEHHGRVQIKVYRGPSEHEHFAPWGYWVKQPADEEHH